MKRLWALGAGVILVAVSACGPATGGSEEHSEVTGRVGDRISLVQSAYCSIQVTGVGARDTELDYLPHVIACENNGAGLEALKAQAIAARSVAYYAMASAGSICDGQGCQVYSCSNQPTALHYQAVAETAQQYLSYANMVTYGFYVSGDSSVSGPACQDSSGSTYITFNDGKSGTSVSQTKLGYVGPPGFGQNRGCMSQWGARCLESEGRDHLGILRFYYGSDIGVTSAPGACSVPNAPTPTPPPAPPTPSGNPAPAPAPSSGATCAGQCGSPNAVGSNPTCYCDDACTGYGDCCADYSSVCGAPASPPPSPSPAPSSGGSCSGACWSSSPAPGSIPACYCDASCIAFGDCCADFAAMCF